MAFDAKVFNELLRKLNEYNSWLVELLHGHYARKLEETTRKTYLEIVQVKTTVAELKELVQASKLLEDHVNHHAAHNDKSSNDHILGHLSKFKEISLAHDISAEQPPSYLEVTRSPLIAKNAVKYGMSAADQENTLDRIRDSCEHSSDDGTTTYGWIEWKSYKPIMNLKTRRSEPKEGNVKRIKELVTLLQASNIPEFRTPKCLGYFDDRADTEESSNPERFGIIFQHAIQYPNAPSPISLLKAIQHRLCPSLTARVAMAHKLATSMLYLHAVKWLHKGLRSDGVTFFPDPKTQDIDFTEPYLSGFEYARPDRDGIHSTSPGGRAPRDELYVHPSYQGANAVGTYRKTFDIYSLGIVLLEIINWRPIHKLLRLKSDERPTPPQLKVVREWLLEDEKSPLTSNIGDRLYTATRSCLQGLTAFGLEEGVNESAPDVGARLQRGFGEIVVDGLAAIVV